MFRIAIITLLFLTLAACSRSMTEGEISYSSQFLTRDIDFKKVTFSGWLTEDKKREKLIEQLEKENAVFPEFSDKAQLISSIPSLFGAAAIAIGNTVIFDRYLLDYSRSVFVSDRWLMAHELVHVWQWQNRRRLGYTFAKIISEHLKFEDRVYEYTLIPGKRFTDYRFEQQGRIVECYAQFRQVRPGSPITRKHEILIREQFPLEQVMQFLEIDSDKAVRIRSSKKGFFCDESN